MKDSYCISAHEFLKEHHEPRQGTLERGDARAGEIISSHKFQVLCKDEHTIGQSGTRIHTAFSTREGHISLTPVLDMHMRDPSGRKGKRSSMTGGTIKPG